MTTRVTRSRISSPAQSTIIAPSPLTEAEYQDFATFDVTTRPKLVNLSKIFKSLGKVIKDDLILDPYLEQKAVGFIMFLRPNDKFNLSVDDVMTKLVPTSHPYEGFITAFKVLISSKYESVIVAALTLFHTLIHRATSAITQHILRYNPTQAFFQSNMLRSLPIVGHEQLHTAIFKVFKRFSNRVIGLTLFNMIIRPAGPYLKRVLSQWRILTDETGELKTFSSLLHTLVYLSVFRNETSDFVLSLPVAHIVTSLLSQRVTVYMNDKLFYKLCQTVTQATKDHKFSFFRWKEMLARLSSEGLLDEMEQMMVPVKHRGRTQGLNSIQPRAMSIKIGCNVAPLHRV